MMTQRDRDALDRYITGNYGEDQFLDPTGDMESDHERHAALGENHWWTCPLCDDEYDVDEDYENYTENLDTTEGDL